MTVARFPAIRSVLAAYRSTEAHITQEQITAAWAEYDELTRTQRSRIVSDQPTMPSEMDYDAKHELRYSYVDVYRMLSKVVPLPRIAHLEAEAQQRQAINEIIDGDLQAAIDAGRRGRYEGPETVDA